VEINELIKKYDVTSKFTELFFPNKEEIERVDPEIPYGNNIIYHSLMIYGLPACGKTTTVNSIAGVAIDRYGNKDTVALMSENGNLQQIMDVFEPKLVNLLFTDNATLAKYEKSTLHDYFMLRNITLDKHQIRNGYILSILALHRFFAIPLEFRSIVDGLIIRDISLNPFDNAIIERFIDNDELYQFIRVISSARSKCRELMNYSVFIGKTLKGIIAFKPRKEFYFNVLGDKVIGKGNIIKVDCDGQWLYNGVDIRGQF
jgi:hypothetical protein